MAIGLSILIGMNEVICCRYKIVQQPRTIKDLIISKKFFTEFTFICLLSGGMYINIELSFALIRLNFGSLAPYLPYLSFLAFIFRCWKYRFSYLILIFLIALVLGAVGI
ncbi:hypothetical protein BTA51_04900 [Hahella sp. CCB-MM4]|nr:hypothetical protein BTA51_04900 [Hahella sp. CCB-MM4]